MNLLELIIGYAAALALVLGYMPQAIKTIRTRRTDDISMASFMLMSVGGLLFAIQGALLDNIPLMITNIITTICSGIVFVIKLDNDLKKKKNK